jgi:tetratricopeptide (TPR) repeat protein
LLYYFRLLVVPFPISPEYPFTLVRQLSVTRFVLPCLVLIALTVGAILLFRYLRSQGHTDAARLVAFSCVWIVLPLLPVLYLKTLRWQDLAHVRYLYLPCMGFVWLVALGIRHVPAGDRKLAGLPFAQATIAAVLVIALACACVVQQMYWASDLLLFSRGVSVAPENPVGLANLGMDIGKRQQYPQAISLFQRALRTDADFAHALFGLGYTYLLLGRAAEAEPLLEKAVRLHPGDSDPDQWAYLGMAALRLQHEAKAEWALRNAIAKRTDVARYHHALALLLEQQGRRAEAASEFRETLKYDPSNADARVGLARVAPAP